MDNVLMRDTQIVESKCNQRQSVVSDSHFELTAHQGNKRMAYPSIDKLQKMLAENVFHYAKDAKKASGRALGTLVEIITFYSLKAWQLEHCVAIERPLPEFANKEITHNVEYSLHPILSLKKLEFSRDSLPLTSKKLIKDPYFQQFKIPADSLKSNALLTQELILRNSCTISEFNNEFLNVYLEDLKNETGHYTVASLCSHPFAIFECKRVGVEDGMRKGPQTIEKAKQGAYVARAVSSLQKVRLPDGRMGGLIHNKDGSFRCEEYYSLLAEIVASHDRDLLSNFILTVGVVSNHGNWFTSENSNKELKVLAQSYDWLLFLDDHGLAQFIDELLLNPKKELAAAKEAFLSSYTGKKGVNQFTKVKISLAADSALQAYFSNNTHQIEKWFNIIAPRSKGISVLREELDTLSKKNWKGIHQ